MGPQRLTPQVGGDAAREWSFQTPGFAMRGPGGERPESPQLSGGVSLCRSPSGQIHSSPGQPRLQPSSLTPLWEVAAQRPRRLGKWAKWSDWFPEPGSESTRAGRRWWGRTEPRQRRQRPPQDALFSTLQGDPVGVGVGNSRHPVVETQSSVCTCRLPAPHPAGAQPPPAAARCWPRVPEAGAPVHSEPGL